MAIIERKAPPSAIGVEEEAIGAEEEAIGADVENVENAVAANRLPRGTGGPIKRRRAADTTSKTRWRRKRHRRGGLGRPSPAGAAGGLRRSR